MAARLDEIDRRTDPTKCFYLSDRRVPLLRAQLRFVTNIIDTIYLRATLGLELLNAGEPEEGLAEFKKCVELANRTPGGQTAKFYAEMDRFMGMCHLRQGELDNCVVFHGPESCLLPLSPAAVHRDPKGARAAIGKFTELLTREPQDLAARWLINIAYMAAGEYPAKVPPQWLIPPRVFDSEFPLPRFVNIAGDLGLDMEGLAGGTVADDFDNDNDIDLMVSRWGSREQLRFFINNGNGTFTERTKEAGLTGLVGGLNMVPADYNNDGFVDVFVLRGAWLGATGRIPNSLIRNNGDGTFEDVTEEAGMLSFHPTQAAAWLDYNNDGWIDLFVGNESLGEEVHPSELYRNNKDGTFTDCAAEAGVAVNAFVKAVASADYDNDGRMDLYLSVRGSTNILLRNEGPVPGEKASTWRFRDVTARAGVGEPIGSFSTWFFDYDNDGWQDLFVSGYWIRNVSDVAADYLGLPHPGERSRLFHNNRNGTFSDVTKQAGLFKIIHTMGCNFGDLDNDGYLDFYAGTGDPDLATIIPNRMFRNDAGRRFQDVTTAGGFGHLQKGHAISFADFDNDGDQDIYESLGGAYTGDAFRNALFENPGMGNRWIGLRLQGVKSNRSAIGARIECTVKTPEGKRKIHKIVNSGGSFGANPLRQHIGLGSAATADVNVVWPVSGRTQTFTNLAAGQWYHIVEDSTNAVRLQVERFTFARRAEEAAGE